MGRREKLKVLFTNLTYLSQNYGAQAIAFPIMKKLSEFFDAEYAFTVDYKHYERDVIFAKEYNVSVIPVSIEGVLLERNYYLGQILYILLQLLRNKKFMFVSEKQKRLFLNLLKEFGESDIIIDLSGIEFVGDIRLRGKWASYFSTVYYQRLAEKYNKKYLKYTKSYGPIRGILYSYFVKKSLNRLPFVFVRGDDNLKEIQNLNLKVPIYSFPDISIALEPENKDWALQYLSNIGLNINKPIFGLSPSSVIANMKVVNDNICGVNHIRLCKEIVKLLQDKDRQILLIPHSIDPVNNRNCDLWLSKEIYRDLTNKTNVYIIPEALDYPKMKAIIGLLEFYITSRYHSLSSALSMLVPVISLSWHIKYKDIMSLFLDDYLVVDSRSLNIKEALRLIEKYYKDQSWFNVEIVKKRKENLIQKIDESIRILVEEIKKSI